MINHYLNEHYLIHKRPIKIQRFVDYPCPCAYYPDDYKEYIEKYGRPNNREVLPYEIIIEMDFKGRDEEETRETINKDSKKITSFLREQNIGYIMFKSGGLGIHAHTYFNELRKLNRQDQKQYKKAFLKWISDNLDLTIKLDPQGTLNMIQMEEELHRKLGFKTLIEKYNIPYGKQKFPELKYKSYRYNENYDVTKLRPNNNCGCVNYFFSKDFFMRNDGKKRAMFVLIGYYKREKLSEKEIYERIRRWNEIMGNPLVDSSISQAIKYNNGLVGCNYTHLLLEELGVKTFRGIE